MKCDSNTKLLKDALEELDISINKYIPNEEVYYKVQEYISKQINLTLM